MTGTVRLKEVNGEGIWLKEVNIDRYTWIYYALTFLWISMGMGAIFLEIIGEHIISLSEDLVLEISLPIWCLVFGFFSIGFTQLIFKIGVISKPSYEIYLSAGTRDERVTIERTTPEADQIAICKAVQELEPKLREQIKWKHEMERIASKCK